MYFYIDPALITLGPISVRYYGLVYALTFLIIYITLLKKKHLINFSEEECSEFILTTGISMMVFGRLFHFIIDNPALLLQNPLEFFAIWHGGIAFFGSFVGLIGGAVGYLYLKKKPIQKTFFYLSDMIALISAGALIFGRLANFINQELVGTVSNAPWCVNFLIGFSEVGKPLFDPICRHPYQLYAALTHLLLFGILYMISKKESKRKPKKQRRGLVFLAFIVLYSFLRFIVDFWREDSRILLGLTSWQLISIVGFGVGIWMYTYMQKRHWDKKGDTHDKK